MKTFQLLFFLVSISWSTIEDLAFNLCLFLGSPLECLMHIFFGPFPNKIQNKPFVHETWGHMKHFNYFSFLVSISWSTIEDLAFNLCLFFRFTIRAFDAYVFGPVPSKFKAGHFVHEPGGHMKHFNYISFWWVSHGVPLNTLHSTCAYFLVPH